MTFQRACALTDVPKGSVIAREIDGTPVAIVHCDDGTFHAVADECTHQEVPLSEGDVDGCTVECWLHGSAFDLRTGAPTSPPATEPVAVYPVEVRDGDLYVSLVPSNSPSAGSIAASASERGADARRPEQEDGVVQ